MLLVSLIGSLMLLVGTCAVHVFASWIGWLTSEWRRKLGRIAARKTIPIAEARPGVVTRVEGKVVPVGKPLRAPLSGRECVAFVIGSDADEPYIEEQHIIDFVIRDLSGEALLRVEGASVLLAFDLRRNRKCEGALELGADVIIVGVPRRPVDEALPTGGYRDCWLRLVFAAADGALLEITNAALAFHRR